MKATNGKLADAVRRDQQSKRDSAALAKQLRDHAKAARVEAKRLQREADIADQAANALAPRRGRPPVKR